MRRSVRSRPADRRNLLGPHLIDSHPMVVPRRLDDVSDLLGPNVFRVFDVVHDGLNAIEERVAIVIHGPYDGTVAVDAQAFMSDSGRCKLLPFTCPHFQILSSDRSSTIRTGSCCEAEGPAYML